jgi:hypothetical protein
MQKGSVPFIPKIHDVVRPRKRHRANMGNPSLAICKLYTHMDGLRPETEGPTRSVTSFAIRCRGSDIYGNGYRIDW